MEASFHIDERLLNLAIHRLGRVRGAIPLAAARAVNRTVTQARAATVRAVIARYAIKAGDARKAMKIKKASSRHHDIKGLVIAVSGSIPLIRFKGGHKKPFSAMARRPRLGAKARVLKSSRPKVIPHAFVARMKGGHVGLFIRLKEGSTYRPGRGGKGRKVVRAMGKGALAPRLPVKELKSPGVAVMARKVVPPLRPELQRTLNRRFTHEIRRGLMNAGLTP